MKIKQMTAREENKSCGLGDSILCEVHITNGATAYASISLNSNNTKIKTTPSYVIETIQDAISPLFEGKVIDILECDELLEQIYKSGTFPLLSRAVFQGLSVAFAQAQCRIEQIQLFELLADLCQNETITIPYPFFQIHNEHFFDSKFALQNIFFLPLGSNSFRHSLSALEVVSPFLKKNFTSPSDTVYGIFEKIDQLLIKHKLRDLFMLGLESNAELLYDKESGNYTWENDTKTSEDLLSIYEGLIEKYGVFSIQNGFALEDVLGAGTFLERFGESVQLVANTTLSPNDIPALENVTKYANACIIRPDDYITVTQAVEHVIQMRAQGVNTIIAQRYRTNPYFFVDFAIGTSAGQIQTLKMSPDFTQTIFDRLLDIEDTMTFSLL